MICIYFIPAGERALCKGLCMEVMLWIPWCKSIPQEWTFGLGCSSVVEHGPYRQFTFGLGLSSLVEPGLPSSLFFVWND